MCKLLAISSEFENYEHCKIFILNISTKFRNMHKNLLIIQCFHLCLVYLDSLISSSIKTIDVMRRFLL